MEVTIATGAHGGIWAESEDLGGWVGMSWHPQTVAAQRCGTEQGQQEGRTWSRG